MPFNRFKYSDAILERADLSPGARCVYQFLVNRADASGCCWPSYEFIAKRCGMSQRHTRRLIGRLDTAGFIRIERRTHTGKRKDSETNRYTVRDPKLVEVGTPQPLGGWGPTDPQGGGSGVLKVGTCGPPKQTIEQTIEQTTGGGGDIGVPEPDKTGELKTVAGTYRIRCIDKLRDAGVTVADLEACHDQGHRDGLLVNKVIEIATARRDQEAADERDRLARAPKSVAEADSVTAMSILVSGSWADSKLKGDAAYARAREMVGPEEYARRILAARDTVPKGRPSGGIVR